MGEWCEFGLKLRFSICELCSDGRQLCLDPKILRNLQGVMNCSGLRWVIRWLIMSEFRGCKYNKINILYIVLHFSIDVAGGKH